jgi:uncharacterized damage-inducible protein DinB
MPRLHYLTMVHGVTLRVIDAFGDADLDYRPAPGTRSPRELIFHMYAQERALAEAVRDGKMSADAAAAANPEEGAGCAACAALTTARELRDFADECHRRAAAIYEAASDEQLARVVESPFGKFPAWQYFTFAYDEHWHHRGQLYTYLRLLGKEPPMLYDYGSG